MPSRATVVILFLLAFAAKIQGQTNSTTNATDTYTFVPTPATTASPIPELGPSLDPLPVDPAQIAKVQALANYMAAQWAALDAACDPKAPFAVAYLYMTANALHLIQTGYFDDGNKMADFITHFAGRYVAAYDNWAAGNLSGVSAPWQAYFSFLQTNRSDTTQDLTLGMNAHINYDLAIVTFEQGYVNPTMTADYYRVNDLMNQIDTNITLALGRYDAQFYNTDWVSQTYFTVSEQVVISWRTGALITATTYQTADDLPLGAVDQLTVGALEAISETTAVAAALPLSIPYPYSTAPSRIAYCMTQNQLPLPGSSEI